MSKKRALSLRIDADLLKRVDAVTVNSVDPYAPSKNQVIERGIALALAEIEARKKASKQ